jgi:hypothetical protein
MNVKKALKTKAKLIKFLGDTFTKVRSYNSIEQGTERPYDPRTAFNEWQEGIEKLIAIKTAIHKANSKVYDKIFRLSELKSVVSQLRSIDCTQGKFNSGYGREPIVREAIITITERDELIKKYETEIEDLQEELDAHNLKTLVKVE